MNRILLVALISLFAGWTVAAEHATEIEMKDTWWQLVRYVGETGEWVSALPETTVDLRFSDGQLSGSGGCNRYFGSYEIDGAEIRFPSPLGSTQMACVPPIDEQEQRYLALLPATAHWRVDAEQLQLLEADGSPVLEFIAFHPPALEGTEWQASGINNGKGGVVSSASTPLSTAVFTAGTVSGSAGCNRFNASYEIEGEQIRIGPAAATRKFCAEPEGIMEQEQQFLAALEKGHTFQVGPESLELRDEDGALQVGFRAGLD